MVFQAKGRSSVVFQERSHIGDQKKAGFVYFVVQISDCYEFKENFCDLLTFMFIYIYISSAMFCSGDKIERIRLARSSVSD